MRTLAALLTVGVLALSACGSSDDETSSDTTVAAGDTTTAPAEEGGGEGPLGADCEAIDATGSETDGGDWILQTSSTPTMLTELETALTNCEPIVVSLWHPHWAYAAYSIKDLEDPNGSMGEGEEIWTVANAAWAEESPDLVAALESFTMTDAQLAELEVFTANEYADDPAAGAEEWLSDPENQEMAEGWVEGLEGDGETVEIGLIAWDEAIAVTNVWKVLLEDAGYTVNVTELDAGPLFGGLAAGDLDVFFDTWLPTTHEDYWAEFGDDLVQVSQWFEGSATLNIAVPTYMNIDSMDELAAWSPDVGSTIVGIEPGAGLSRITQCAMLPDYELGEAPDASVCETG